MADEEFSDSDSDDGLGLLTEAERDILDNRRRAELVLVKKYDKIEINPRRECWFLISSKWMKEWGKYIEGKAEAPGPISNLDLYADDIGGRALLANLEPVEHYRGLHPTMWFIFKELYGKDKAPELCRYNMKIYDPAVVGTHREQASRGSALAARVAVSKMRESFLPSSDEESVEGDEPIVLCLYKSHVEFILFHCFTCCAHIGKKGPAYKALSQDYDCSDDELGMESEEEDYDQEEIMTEEEKKKAQKRAKRVEAREKVAKARRRKTAEKEERDAALACRSSEAEMV